ncbi:cytochrome b/b6 domain-containing protein [Hirschia litorea]|uniref:Cytochrome b/b6 domain-containing protein n=1 Tax=Hirschia litorea TaxID=1199156 RepID=A0ABW2IN85_9PROT
MHDQIDKQKSTEEVTNKKGSKRLVWDLPLRLFHWLLVLSIAASWATAKAGVEWTEIHFLLGYWTAGLLVFRLIWGFVGPKHARFASFIPSVKSVFLYLRGFLKGHGKQAVGHNPMGALMVFAILAIVGAQVVTGLFASDDILFSGPFNSLVDGKLSETITRLHNFNFDVILFLIFAHISAVLIYLFKKKQNLILPMITGRKSKDVVPDDEAIKSSRLFIALCVVAVSVLIVWGVLSLAPPPVDDFY